tara:strand:- start:389 stop:1258 length:870 start_codon:yes stop_codon:yes gene_type:complete
LASIIVVSILGFTGCDGDKSIVDQLREANIILPERDDAGDEDVENQPVSEVDVIFNLGSQSINDIASFKTVYVATQEQVELSIGPEKSYHIEQMAALKLENEQLDQDLVDQLSQRSVVVADLKDEFGDMYQASEKIAGGTQQRLTNRRKLSMTNTLLEDYDQFLEQTSLRLTPLDSAINEIKVKKSSNNERMQGLRESLENMEWFDKLPVLKAKRFSVQANGQCQIRVPTFVDTYVWSTAEVSADNMEFRQVFRWFLRCPESIDDAGVLALTTANGTASIKSKNHVDQN